MVWRGRSRGNARSDRAAPERGHPHRLAAPDVADVLWRDGAQVWVSSPEEFRAYIGKEITRWADLVQRANIHLH